MNERNHNSDCAETLDKLSPWLDGALPPVEAATVSSHIEGCDTCRAELAALKQTVAWLGEIEPVSPPGDLLEGIHERLATADDGGGRIVSFSLRQLAATAAILLVFAYIGLRPHFPGGGSADRAELAQAKQRSTEAGRDNAPPDIQEVAEFRQDDTEEVGASPARVRLGTELGVGGDVAGDEAFADVGGGSAETKSDVVVGKLVAVNGRAAALAKDLEDVDGAEFDDSDELIAATGLSMNEEAVRGGGMEYAPALVPAAPEADPMSVAAVERPAPAPAGRMAKAKAAEVERKAVDAPTDYYEANGEIWRSAPAADQVETVDGLVAAAAPDETSIDGRLTMGRDLDAVATVGERAREARAGARDALKEMPDDEAAGAGARVPETEPSEVLVAGIVKAPTVRVANLDASSLEGEPVNSPEHRFEASDEIWKIVPAEEKLAHADPVEETEALDDAAPDATFAMRRGLGDVKTERDRRPEAPASASFGKSGDHPLTAGTAAGPGADEALDEYPPGEVVQLVVLAYSLEDFHQLVAPYRVVDGEKRGAETRRERRAKKRTGETRELAATKAEHAAGWADGTEPIQLTVPAGDYPALLARLEASGAVRAPSGAKEAAEMFSRQRSATRGQSKATLRVAAESGRDKDAEPVAFTLRIRIEPNPVLVPK